MRFRDVVAAELERRRRLDPRYSLRRYARTLGVHHSTLSRLLRGARPIPLRTLRTLGKRLGMPAAEIAAATAREDAAAVALAIDRPAFRPDCRWLASVAGISIDRVNIALHALLRSGVLRMVSPRQWNLEREPSR